MLDVISTPMNDLRDNHQVSCWMDITRGQFPNSKPIEGPVKVGENLTMAIYIKDKKESTDIRVKDCYAYDAREDAVRGGQPITIMMLTSDQGCPLNNKVMDFWKTTTATGSSGASVVAYTTISAFKFPEKESVFLTCNVELCTNGCLTFCNDDTSRSHTLSPAFNASDHNSPVHRHLTNVSFVTTRVSTTTPSAINFEKEDERERESDGNLFLDPDIRRRKNPRIHRISIRPASHETEETEDVDVILNGDVNPKADFARLVFQGTDPPMTSGESEGDSRVGNLQDESTTVNPDESETTTPETASTPASDDESEKQSTTPSSEATTTSDTSTDASAATTLTPTSNDTSATTTSPLDITTQSSSDLEARTTQASDATETTTGKTADLQQSKQNNITESDSQKRNREGKARSQELEDDKDNNSDDILSIKPVFNGGVKGGIKGGTKGGSSSSERRVKNSSLRKYPAFLPRPPVASARRRAKKEDRIGSSVSSSSRSSSSRRRNSSSNRNRRRDANRRNRNNSNNNNRRRKLVTQASSRDASVSSRNSGVGWRMEPLPSSHDPGHSDIPFRASRQSRRYARPPWNQPSAPVSSYHRRA